jgi:membrane protein YqaA with SNARE-associated domain
MKRNKKIFIPVFIFATILLFLPLFFSQEFGRLKNLGLLGIFLINFLGSATIFLPVPSIISVGVGAAFYNPVLVACLAAFGSTLGEIVDFVFGYSSKEFLNLRRHSIIYWLENFIFKRYGSVIVFLFSLVPNPFFDSIGIFAGISAFPLKKFFIFVFLGRFARNLLIALFSSLFLN